MIDVDNLKSELKKFGGERPVIIRAPGRINLIGEHTDYNHGFVLPAAIDKQMIFAIERVENSQEVKVMSLDYGEKVVLNLEALVKDQQGWQGYFTAILEEVLLGDLPIGGLICVFSSNIPLGAGVSSSAALCCGFISGLNAIFNWGLSKLEMAKIAQASEHRLGAMVGLMDQFAVMFGRTGNVIQLDCLDYSYEYFSLNLKDYSLVLINTNVKHNLVDSAYNERRASCERVLAELQKTNSHITTLRDVSLKNLNENTEGISQQDIKRVNFVLEENERVLKTTEALTRGDLKAVGSLLYLSHQGLAEEYQVSCRELDLLVGLTRNEKDIYGARMMGGGFGGCTINLIKTSSISEIVANIMNKYYAMTGIKAEYYHVNIAEGVTVID